VESTVLLRRRAPGVFPVAVTITFDDGREILEAWDGVDTWRELKYEDEARITRVEVDRDRWRPLPATRTFIGRRRQRFSIPRSQRLRPTNAGRRKRSISA
jgi:hypothetical protein